MGLETISETTFLLTELRYTLGQLHVQVLDLDDETRRTSMCGDRSIERILEEMRDAEDSWQSRYSEILHTSAPTSAESGAIPLPVQGDEDAGTENDFEHKRARTIVMLEAVAEPWPQALVDIVKEQIGQDRRMTTDIAEGRKSYFSQPHSDNLQQPLTDKPEPEKFREQEA